MVMLYDAKAYSRGRSAVMGVATLMILWFHCTVILTPGSFQEQIKLMNDIGVDLFFFASGVGIFFSVEKHRNYRIYLKGRLIRILPAFFLVTVLWTVYRKYFYWEFIPPNLWMELTTLNFWVQGDLSCWYVAGTLVLYLLTPGYMVLWKKCRFLNLIAMAAIFVLSALSYRIPLLFPLQHKLIFLFRVPVYLAGLQMGKWIKEGKQLRIFWPGVLMAIVFCCFVIVSCYGHTSVTIPWGYKYAAYGPVAVMLSLFLAKMPENPVTGYLGTRSLEIYLVFEKVLEAITMRPQMEVLDGETRILKNLLALAVTLVLVEILRYICKMPGKILKKYRKTLI